MRLASFLLSVSTLAWAAQPSKLPWQTSNGASWQSGQPIKTSTPFGECSEGPIHVSISQDGTLHLTDGKGVVLLRTGLPGRPLKAWRDGGHPLSSPIGRFAFPNQTPLQEGLGSFPLDKADFRSLFKGLLWMLSDDACILTVLHPATQGILHLHLPEACRHDLHFLEDRLSFKDAHDTAWTLSYAALLPQWISLGRSKPKPKPGTALDPFPD